MNKTRTFNILLDDYDLGSVNETINVLESGYHTVYQEDINIIPEFDTNAKRWELFQSPKAWEFITEDYRAFWPWIRESKNFKQVNWVDDAVNKPVTESITAMTDNKNEFKQVRAFQYPMTRHLNQAIAAGCRNEQNGKSKLVFIWEYTYTSGTSTVYANRLIVMKYNPETAKLERLYFPGTNPSGVKIFDSRQSFFKCPWLFGSTDFVFLEDKDDEFVAITGPGTTTPFGIVSEREKFVLFGQRAAFGHRFVYGIDDKEYFDFTGLAQEEGNKPVFTNVNETHAIMAIATNRYDLIDRTTKTMRVVTPNVALALPDAATKCTLSPDGTMMAWTDRVATTPRLRIMRLRDGMIIYTSSVNGACANAIWTNSNTIYVNSTTNVLSRYTVQGNLNQLFVQEIGNYVQPTTTGNYLASYLEELGKLIFIKQAAADTQPFFYIVDELTGRVEYTSAVSTKIGAMVSVGAQSMVRRIPYHDNWFLIPNTIDTGLILLKYNKQTQLWEETVLANAPIAISNTQYGYLPPVFFDKGTICAWRQHQVNTDALAIPVYDLNTGKTIEVLPSQSFANIRKLDESHLAFNGATQTVVYEVDKVNRKLIQKFTQLGSGNSQFYGFNDTTI